MTLIISLYPTLIFLTLYFLAYSDSFDNIQASNEFTSLFFDDGSTLEMSSDQEYGLVTEPNQDFLVADDSDACHIDSYQTLNKKKRTPEECQNPQNETPINVPQFGIDPHEFLDPDPDDFTLVYPFDLPEDNYEICPKPPSGRLYAVCDSGIETDNVFDETRDIFNLRYCTLYNPIAGCPEPRHHLWCCQYYYLDELGVELGIILEGVGVGRFCERASFLRLFAIPAPGPLKGRSESDRLKL